MTNAATVQDLLKLTQCTKTAQVKEQFVEMLQILKEKAAQQHISKVDGSCC
jgi:hypothetical protein